MFAARLLPLSLLFLSVACSPRARIGVEAVLAETGLHTALFDQAEKDLGVSLSIRVAEQKELVELLRAGELEAILSNGDLEADALLREGIVSAADPILHGEALLVGPKADPAGMHQQRTLPNALRTLIEADAAFFQCTACGVRAREEAMFGALQGIIPRRGSPFLDVGRTEDDIIKAMQKAPAYGLLSRPTVLRALKKGEWAFKPMWSTDALLVDTYRFLVRPTSKIEDARRPAIDAVKKWISSDKARPIIEKVGSDAVGQPFYRAGAAAPGEAFKAPK